MLSPQLVFHNELAPDAPARRDLPGYDITRTEASFSGTGITVHVYFAPIPARQASEPYTFTSDLDIVTKALLDEAASLRSSGLVEDNVIGEALKAVADRINRTHEDMA